MQNLSDFYDGDYAADRLVGTMVAHKTKSGLYYVSDVDGGRVAINEVGKSIGTMEWVELCELDLTPPKIGYMNHSSGHPYWITRTPARQWKQGLRLRNTNISLDGISLKLECKQVVDAYNNKYPTIDECMDSIENCEVFGMAFAKDFSAGAKRKKNDYFNLEAPFSEIHLSYKGRVVGGFHQDKPFLSNKHLFLSEALEEAL